MSSVLVRHLGFAYSVIAGAAGKPCPGPHRYPIDVCEDLTVELVVR
jgi:hypothetical protein